MKNTVSWLHNSILFLALLVLIPATGYPQDVPAPLHLKGYTTVLPVQGATFDAIHVAAQTPNEIPLWNFSIAASPALGGATFTGTMVGRSPFAHGKTTTTVNLQIIPLKITIGSTVFDPTATDSCITGTTSKTALDLIQKSPLFTNNPYMMNGVNVGSTQYIDAFQRANFWQNVQGTPYHLAFAPTVLTQQSTAFSAPSAGVLDATTVGGCGKLGLIDINKLDLLFSNAAGTGPGTIMAALAGQVTPGTFPMFLTDSVFFTDGPPDLIGFSNCCILGYHSGFMSGINLQIYSPFALDTTTLFGGDVETLSHEIAEAIDDPTGNNATPVWGCVGQVLAPGSAAGSCPSPTLANGGCQNNLEVGDPLSENGGITNTQAFSVNGSNGFTYHLQELAFFSWYFGGSSLGSGGGFSNNGTFGGPAKLCPPGGTTFN